MSCFTETPCILYNDMAAAVAPEILLPNRRMGQSVGRETILECIITAYPQAVNYWQKDGRRVASSSKYRVDAYDEEDKTVVLSLRIHDIERADYGEYTCVAANALGRDQETMYLYGTACLSFSLCTTVFYKSNLDTVI